MPNARDPRLPTNMLDNVVRREAEGLVDIQQALNMGMAFTPHGFDGGAAQFSRRAQLTYRSGR
jgi:hypothetical protein